MKRGIIYLVAAVILVAGVGAAVTRLRQPARQLAADLKIINADSGEVMSSATYQRFGARRDAVAAMRADLRGLAAAESTFVADSGRTTTSWFMGRYAFVNDKSNVGPTMQILRDRWVATIGNVHTSMTCTITAMLDTATGHYHAREPMCPWTPEKSTVIANAPVPSSPASEPPAPAEPAPEPRHHRDWGPVNNTPPPTPYIARNTCEGEGCDTHGVWAACSTVVAVQAKQPGAAPVFTVRPGEDFTALTSDVHVEVPGIVAFRATISNPPHEEGLEIDGIQFTPADTLYLLNRIGEGYLIWWFRGRADTGYQFWSGGEYGGRPQPTDPAVLIRRPKSVTWVRVRNAAGQEGWIVHDLDKMATGGYMDERERCLHPGKH